MKNHLYFIKAALHLLAKAILIAAKWAGQSRKKALEEIAKMDIDEKDKELLFLRDRIIELETQVAILQKQRKKDNKKPHYSLRERLFILWHREYFQIPRRKAKEYYCIARSTLYRWRENINDAPKSALEPVNKTPRGIAALIWKLHRRISNGGK